MRRTAAVILTGLLLLGLAGCASPFQNACPAIGWLNAVTVDTSAVPGVSAVQFCVESECSPAPGSETDDDGSLLWVNAEEDGWVLSLDMSAPEAITIRLFDANNLLIRESEESISWTHSDDPCGGPSTAETLILKP